MDLTIKNEDFKAKILRENAENAGQAGNLGEIRDYVITNSENDPSFFRWLFGNIAESWNDFEIPEEADQAWEDFISEYF